MLLSLAIDPPHGEGERLLPGFNFADAYRFTISDRTMAAPQITELLFAEPPAWVGGLMALRNRLAALLGLEVVEMGRFPVMSEEAGQVVLGLDDHHLDFRIAIFVAPPGQAPRDVIIATYVRTHRALGRLYLAAVLPFHRIIATTMARNAAHSLRGNAA